MSKRLNISVPEKMHAEFKQIKGAKLSKICQRAIQAEIDKNERDKILLVSFLI